VTINPSLQSLLAPYARPDVPGLVLGVARHGRTVHRIAVGQANLEHGVAMQPATRAQIASVTKHFACAAALVLVDEGRLSLDDEVGRWLPEIGLVQGRPTLRQLMDHTAGLRCYLDLANSFNGFAAPVPAALGFALQARQRGMNFEPGARAAYCNGGYLLLSHVIERASGRSFEDALRTRLFEPLRLDATECRRRPSFVSAAVATKYLPAGEGAWRHGFELNEEVLGEGGMLSSVDDLLRWCAHLRRATGPVSLDALTRVAPTASGYTPPYRLGLEVENWRGVEIASHAGGLVGASSCVLMVPALELDVVVLANRMMPANLASEPPAPRTRDHRDLLGLYRIPETGLLLEFVDADGALAVRAFDGDPVPLRSHTPQRAELPFRVPGATGSAYFRRETSGALQIVLHGGACSMERVAPTRLDAARWIAGLAGAFASDEAGGSLRLEAVGGRVVAHVRGEYGTLRLSGRPVADDVVVFGIDGHSGGWAVEVEGRGGAAPALRLSTTRTWRLPLTRTATAGVAG
jgi:CubicO group peptidase (beta-lactamase class C family)